MGWLKERSLGNYDLGSNLYQEFFTNMAHNLKSDRGDIGGSSVLGNQETDLLREVNYRCTEDGSLLLVRCLKWQVSLQSKQNAGLSEQQQGYLFQMNAVIPHKTSQQAHARLVNYTSTSVTLV